MSIYLFPTGSTIHCQRTPWVQKILHGKNDSLLEPNLLRSINSVKKGRIFTVHDFQGLKALEIVTNRKSNKVECVFPMVIWPEIRMGR